MRLAALAFALAAAVVLTGCVPQDPAPVASPDPAFQPVFASDEEALAAAEAAYGEYVRVTNLILAEGGANPDRIDAIVGQDLGSSEKEGFQEFRERGLRAVGEAAFSSMSLQAYDHPLVVAYVCSDFSNVVVVDANGAKVGANPSPRTPFVVTFAIQDADQLVLLERERWEGGGVCE